MKKIVRFYKEENDGFATWYADVPNHTKAENEMVMGSDVALDILANGKNELFLEVSDEPIIDALAHFTRTSHDDDGAFYQVCANADFLDEIWICNVTHDVLGEHPVDIYIKYVENYEN